MGLVYLQEIGDQEGLEELRRELGLGLHKLGSEAEMAELLGNLDRTENAC